MLIRRKKELDGGPYNPPLDFEGGDDGVRVPWVGGRDWQGLQTMRTSQVLVYECNVRGRSTDEQLVVVAIAGLVEARELLWGEVGRVIGIKGGALV